MWRFYGAHPGHLLVVAAGLVVAAFAARPLLAEHPVPVLRWFVSGTLAHDLVLLPIYVALDGVLVAWWRRHPGRVGWLNHVRIPVAVSAMLLLVWYPIITRRADSFQRVTGRNTDSYLPHWLFVTGLLAVASAAIYLTRFMLAVRHRRAAPPQS